MGIEKDEELLVTYHAQGFESREERQQKLLKTHLFRCFCSECSLVGEELEENERMRAELREKTEKIEIILSSKEFFDRFNKVHQLNVKRAVKLSEEMMILVKKLKLQKN